MSQPAARVTDMHVCPMVTPGTPPVPHVGGLILPPGGVNVLIGNLPAARVGDMCTCVGPPDVIIQGAFNVMICGRPAARMGDSTAHGGKITTGMPTVLIGMSAGGGGAPSVPTFVPLPPMSAPRAGKSDFTKDETKQIEQALKDQKKQLEDKKAALEKWDDAAKKDFKKWFGTTDEAKRNEIKNRIDKLIKLNGEYSVNNFKHADVTSVDVYAYVYPNDDKTIYLGDHFWNAPATGTNSKGGTMNHEMSHFDSISGTHDHVYGTDDAEDLATSDPESALENADNFEYYLEH